MKQIWILFFILIGCHSHITFTPKYKRGLVLLKQNEIESAFDFFRGSCSAFKDDYSCNLHYKDKESFGLKQIPINSSVHLNNSLELTLSHQKDIKTYEHYFIDIKNYQSIKAKVSSVHTPHKDFWVTKLNYQQLKQGNKYLFVLIDHFGNLIDKRLITYEDHSDKDQLQLAVASCMYEGYPVQEIIWDHLVHKSPHYLLMIGDNTYIDTGVYRFRTVTKHQIWRRYLETRNKTQVYKAFHPPQMLAMWDDHDYGVNNGGVDFVHKEESKKAFRTFFSVLDNDSFNNGPGNSYQFKTSKFNFLFLDNRWFRESNKISSGDHLGKEQINFAKQNLSQNQLNIIIMGDQFFGGYHKFESYQGNHPQEFNRFMSITKSHRKFFITGDRHLSEVMKHPEYGYEITSSPIHSKVFPGSMAKKDNPLRINGVDDKFNFNIITIHSGGNVKVNAFDKDSLLYQVDFRI